MRAGPRLHGSCGLHDTKPCVQLELRWLDPTRQALFGKPLSLHSPCTVLYTDLGGGQGPGMLDGGEIQGDQMNGAVHSLRPGFRRRCDHTEQQDYAPHFYSRQVGNWGPARPVMKIMSELYQ